jgi:hypothetical protein
LGVPRRVPGLKEGFIAEQPGNVTVYSAVAREFNTKAKQPGAVRRKPRILSRSARDLNTSCRTARDFNKIAEQVKPNNLILSYPGMTKSAGQPGALAKVLEQPGI